MTSGSSSGFARAIEFLCFIASVIAAFVYLPVLNARTSDWVIHHIITGFGAQHLEWLRFGWQAFLFLLIFAAVRAVLGLIFSATALAIALKILSMFRKDD